MSSGSYDPVFELEQLGRRFGDKIALADLTFRVPRGQRVALVGPSGAGKTTLIRLLNGSLSASSGRLRLLGQDPSDLTPTDLRAVQRRIGTIYQQYHLVHNLRVIHNVNAGHLGSWSLAKAAVSLIWPQEAATAREVLRRVGIPEKLEQRMGDLSGGQQQRVAIARVLAQDPEVILADEPIASVDPGHSQAIMDLLRELSVESGKTLVVSLHDVDFAISHCERMIGLRQGRVLFDAKPESVNDHMVDALYRLDGAA